MYEVLIFPHFVFFCIREDESQVLTIRSFLFIVNQEPPRPLRHVNLKSGAIAGIAFLADRDADDGQNLTKKGEIGPVP